MIQRSPDKETAREMFAASLWQRPTKAKSMVSVIADLTQARITECDECGYEVPESELLSCGRCWRETCADCGVEQPLGKFWCTVECYDSREVAW